MIVHDLSLKFVSITDRGIPDKERVHLRAVRDCDLAQYILLATVESAPGYVYAGARPAYWFAHRDVKAGDNIVIYTRDGTPSVSNPPNTMPTYFYFWGMSVPMFQAKEARAMIVEMSYWEAKG